MYFHKFVEWKEAQTLRWHVVFLSCAEIREAFRVLDRDGNGFISKQELGMAMRSLGYMPSEVELAIIMQRLDMDGEALHKDTHSGGICRACRTFSPCFNVFLLEYLCFLYFCMVYGGVICFSRGMECWIWIRIPLSLALDTKIWLEPVLFRNASLKHLVNDLKCSRRPDLKDKFPLRQ